MVINHTHTHTHTEIHRSVDSKDRVETNGQTDATHCFSFLANVSKPTTTCCSPFPCFAPLPHNVQSTMLVLLFASGRQVGRRPRQVAGYWTATHGWRRRRWRHLRSVGRLNWSWERSKSRVGERTTGAQRCTQPQTSSLSALSEPSESRRSAPAAETGAGRWWGCRAGAPRWRYCQSYWLLSTVTWTCLWTRPRQNGSLVSLLRYITHTSICSRAFVCSVSNSSSSSSSNNNNNNNNNNNGTVPACDSSFVRFEAR